MQHRQLGQATYFLSKTSNIKPTRREPTSQLGFSAKKRNPTAVSVMYLMTKFQSGLAEVTTVSQVCTVLWARACEAFMRCRARDSLRMRLWMFHQKVTKSWHFYDRCIPPALRNCLQASWDAAPAQLKV